ncbi:MAG TPA: adenylate/guanylate cyclase domain-containing protein, partial [Terriglobales bacterium]|nr:adenylate/guanylate cyclase domain-containing protein [Terriglobales bacterium]
DLEKVHRAARELLGLVVQSFSRSEPDLGQTASSATTFARGRAAFKQLTKLSPVTSDQHASLLVVDDNELNRDMLKRRLERLGYSVTCAVDGAEALEKLEAEPFDLLLLDVFMPILNGFEVLSHLKEDRRRRDIPVIVLSASDQLEDAVSCIEMGASDYIMKPFNPVLLQARIGSCLERKRLRDQEHSYLRQIEEEKQRADELLRVILPHDVATELKNTKSVNPRRVEKVGILFCDVVGFTAYSEQHSPETILEHLQTLVEVFEELCVQHGLEKIKTIGDSFMAAAGLLVPVENPALNCVRCGLEMARTAERQPARWQVRVGVNVGPVIAGVVGNRKYQYDIWGDAVNTAARMQAAGRPGAVCVNGETWKHVVTDCSGYSLGVVTIKGKGEQELFIVNGLNA